MKTLTVTEVSRNFSHVLDGVERDQGEVVLVRNHKQIARLVPEPPSQATPLKSWVIFIARSMTARLKLLADGIKRSRKGKTGALSELRNPWAS